MLSSSRIMRLSATLTGRREACQLSQGGADAAGGGANAALAPSSRADISPLRADGGRVSTCSDATAHAARARRRVRICSLAVLAVGSRPTRRGALAASSARAPGQRGAPVHRGAGRVGRRPRAAGRQRDLALGSCAATRRRPAPAPAPASAPAPAPPSAPGAPWPTRGSRPRATGIAIPLPTATQRRPRLLGADLDGNLCRHVADHPERRHHPLLGAGRLARADGALEVAPRRATTPPCARRRSAPAPGRRTPSPGSCAGPSRPAARRARATATVRSGISPCSARGAPASPAPSTRTGPSTAMARQGMRRAALRASSQCAACGARGLRGVGARRRRCPPCSARWRWAPRPGRRPSEARTRGAAPAASEALQARTGPGA